MMSKQYYIREGRRFVKADVPSVVDHRGDYYNEDGSFSKDRRSSSIGLCVIQTPEGCVICNLTPHVVCYEQSQRLIERYTGWRLGDIVEVYVSVTEYEEELSIQRPNSFRIDAYGGLGYLYVDYDPSYAASSFGSRTSNLTTLLFKTVNISDICK